MPATPLLRGPDVPPVTLRSPADLVAVTPYLLGFHPSHSIVVLGFHAGRSLFALRGDLPGPDGPPVDTVAHDLTGMVLRQHATAVALIGYGSDDDVGPLLEQTRRLAERHGLEVMDVLRVDSGRWWSYLCGHPDCCPPSGTPIDVTSSAVAAQCAFAGLTALPARDDVARQVAPVAGPAREAVGRATERAGERLVALLAELPEHQWPERVFALGRTAVTEAIERYGDCQVLTDDELAWLTLLLTSLRVRDHAWEAIRTEQPHLRLWSDVTRRVEPSLAAAPASLLAFTAWRRGDGTLAQLALERALAADPGYSMALLLRDGISRGVPPSVLDGWGTPRWARRLEAVRRHVARPRPRRRRRG